jgi:hypothetical protein
MKSGEGQRPVKQEPEVDPFIQHGAERGVKSLVCLVHLSIWSISYV